MTDYPIPDAALDDRLGFVGTAGSGKTYNSGSGVERVLASGGRVVIPDPLGAWWGLALGPDGNTPSPWRDRSKLFIFGGEHGDFPISEHHGALIGEAVAGMAESAILDLSGFGTKASERRFMLAFLTAFYRHASGDPVHLIFDEADMWAPQRLLDKDGEAAKLLGMMETVVRRGRIKGFIPWLITQRPAVLSKDVLSQVDGLIAFKLTSSQDRAALGAWIEGQADAGQGKEILASLPTLERGTGVVWVPGRGILETATFPAKLTFDSSRTPKRGERKEHRDLKPLDLAGLRAKLTTIEEETKANDPRALKAEVARLTRELAKAERAKPAPAPAAEEVDRLLGDFKTRAIAAEARAASAESKLAKIARLVNGLDQAPFAYAAAAEQRVEPTRGRPTRAAAVTNGAAPLPKPAPVADGSVPAGCAKPLATLAGVYPSGLTEAQWSTAAGYKRSGGTWGTYKSRLRQAGLIEHREGRWFATETGAGAVGNVETPPSPGPDLVRWWASKLPGTSRMAEVLIEAGREGLSREELAFRLDMSAAGGSFGTYLSRLAGPGLIDRSGGIVRLTAEVFP